MGVGCQKGMELENELGFLWNPSENTFFGAEWVCMDSLPVPLSGTLGPTQFRAPLYEVKNKSLAQVTKTQC